MAEVEYDIEQTDQEPQDPKPKPKVKEFAAKIKLKYPEYKDMDDLELTNKIISKYPDYKDQVDFSTTPQPTVEKKNQVGKPLSVTQLPSVSSSGKLPSFYQSAAGKTFDEQFQESNKPYEEFKSRIVAKKVGTAKGDIYTPIDFDTSKREAYPQKTDFKQGDIVEDKSSPTGYKAFHFNKETNQWQFDPIVKPAQISKTGQEVVVKALKPSLDRGEVRKQLVEKLNTEQNLPLTEFLGYSNSDLLNEKLIKNPTLLDEISRLANEKPSKAKTADGRFDIYQQAIVNNYRLNEDPFNKYPTVDYNEFTTKIKELNEAKKNPSKENLKSLTDYFGRKDVSDVLHLMALQETGQQEYASGLSYFPKYKDRVLEAENKALKKEGVFSGMGKSLASGVLDTLSNMIYGAAKLMVGDDMGITQLKDRYDLWSQAKFQLGEQSDVMSVVNQTLKTAPQMAGIVLSRNPELANLVFIGVPSVGESYKDNLTQGLSEEAAMAKAVSDGAIQMFSESIVPDKALVQGFKPSSTLRELATSKFGSKEFKDLFKKEVREFWGEQIPEALTQWGGQYLEEQVADKATKLQNLVANEVAGTNFNTQIDSEQEKNLLFSVGLLTLGTKALGGAFKTPTEESLQPEVAERPSDQINTEEAISQIEELPKEETLTEEKIKTENETQAPIQNISPTETQKADTEEKETVDKDYDDFKNHIIEQVQTIPKEKRGFDWVIDIRGMKQSEIEGAIKDIENGKKTKRRENFEQQVKDMHDRGVIAISRGTGANVESIEIPLKEYFDVVNKDHEPLSDDQISQLNWELSEDSFKLAEDEQAGIFTKTESTPAGEATESKKAVSEAERTPQVNGEALQEKTIDEASIKTGVESPEQISPEESSRAKEPTSEVVPPTEPPSKPPSEVGGEGMDNLDKLANNIPDSGKVAEYMSKETIEKYTGETPQNDQSRGVQELDIALNHGEKIIEEAKKVFGKDYVEKTLDYIDNSKAGISNKALMYVSLENALGREKEAVREDAERVRDITKQQALVYEQSQKFARENSLALNYQKLRKIAQVGYDIEKVTDNFFSAEEIESKGDIKKAVEADADTINKEAEKQEVGGMTPEIEKLIDEGVEKEINKIYEALPQDKKTRAEKWIKALDEVQKKLRGRTYEATLGIPVAIVDFGITVIKRAIKLGVTVEQAVEAGIKRMKEKLSEDKEWKGKIWENEDQFRQDAIEEFKKFAPDVKAIVKEKLIKAGFGRTINVKGQEKQILDWKKLAGKAGTVSKISENVAEVFKQEGKTEEEINRIKDELVKEYIDLRTSVIEKSQNEIAKRNKETVSPEQKSAAKKLAELYTYGLFEQKADEFEVAVNKALGAKVSEQGFQEAKELARAMEIIYANSFKGIRLNDISAKAALERLEDKMRVLLFREAKKQGNTNLKMANLVRNYFEIQQTMLLNNLKQAVENPFSGLQQKVIENINTLAAGNTTKELSQQNRKLMKDVYKDMVLKGGMGYGKVESQFVNRQHIDDYVNKLSDNELYHGIASVVTGKATLNAMDAMYKAGITEKKFTHNLITILTHPTNANRMNKADALKYVSEHLTGQSFKDAQKTSKQIIEQINKDAGKELVPTNQEMIDRFANDIVKASLEMGGKITPEQVKAAYGAAYKGAGLGIGHEANNILSATIKGYSARIEGEINNAIKNKEWNRAAALTYKGVLFRNILNPFVGGGTNWLMLKLEKTGLGLFTGLAYKIGSKQDIDLSTKTGLARLETRLYNQGRWKDNIMRGLIGGAVTWGSYALFLALANSDAYREWRKKNRWATRYLDIITPEPLLTKMALEDKDPKKALKQYAGQSFNRNDAFSAEEKLLKGAAYFASGESDKGWGAWGEMVGSKANAPLPWRLFKDGQVLYQGIKGQDPYHGDYKPSSGFFNGYFQGGVIEWLGARPKPNVEQKEQTFKVYQQGNTATKSRDATQKEVEKVNTDAERIFQQDLKSTKNNKGWGYNQYNEITIDDDEIIKSKRVDWDKLTDDQKKDLESRVKTAAKNKAKKLIKY